MPPRSRRTFRTVGLCALAILVCLVVPAVAFGGNGEENNNGAPTYPSEAQTTTSSDAPTSDAGSTTQSTPAADTATATPDTSQSAGNGNASDQNAPSGSDNQSSSSSANTPAFSPSPDPAPAVDNATDNGQSNADNSNSAGGQANANQTPADGGNAIDPNSNGNGLSGQNSDHSANANANANSSQDSPTNVNVDVRVGQPGDNGAVVQGNNSTAAAAAGASGGSSGSGAPQQSATGTTGSTTTAAGPTGAGAPAPSQADSTGGETIPNANSPPCGAPGSDSSTTTASSGDTTPTASGTSPSASYVNGQCSGSQTGANGTGNAPSGPEATDVTAGSGLSDGEATPVTVDVTGGDGSDVTIDDGSDDSADPPAPVVVITAPTPTSSGSADSATATGTSSQVDPGNVNTSVRVLSPGENGPVYQTNTSTASAAAGATGSGSNAAGATNSADALPTATSNQVNPVNVNVSIRVGSPGNDAAVTQANTSTATAGSVDPSLIDAALADLPANGPNSYGDLENASSVVQDLAQCGSDASDANDDETECGSAPDSAIPTTDSGSSAVDRSTASATQQAPSNVSVSIRVASPGADGLVTQLNNASATGGTSVTTVTDPDNLALSIVIPGSPADIVIPPDASTAWNWNWNWTTGTAPTDPGATPTGTPEWAWNWTAPAAGAPDATSTPAASAGTPGMWTWTWTWTRGDWSVSWTYQQACSCNWNWNWTWVWPADAPTAPSAPSSTSVPLPPPPANPQISQTNDSSATAAAITTFDGSQEMAIEGDGDQTQYQALTSIQTAIATADASQVAPRNLIVVTGGAIDGIKQVNHVAAASTAAAFDTETQTVAQHQTATDDGAVHSVSSIQVTSTLQTAISDATAAQAHAANLAHVWSLINGNQARIGQITQMNDSVAVGFAAVESHTSQSAGQSQVGGGADQTASAFQEAMTTQANTATAHVGQAGVKNTVEMEIPWNGLWNPPITQSNDVSAASVSTSYSETTQTLVQEAAGDGVEWDQNAQQVSIVKQGGAASSGASQANLENLAGWTGTLRSPAGPPSTAGEGGGGESVPLFETPPIVATPPETSVGVLAGSAYAWGSSSVRIRLLATPHVAGALGTGGTAATPPAVTTNKPSTPPERYVHMLFNLLGAGSSALVLLLGAMPFAALLALFMIAALVVGRLQYAMPALGRSVDFARRERPG